MEDSTCPVQPFIMITTRAMLTPVSECPNWFRIPLFQLQTLLECGGPHLAYTTFHNDHNEGHDSTSMTKLRPGSEGNGTSPWRCLGEQTMTRGHKSDLLPQGDSVPWAARLTNGLWMKPWQEQWIGDGLNYGSLFFPLDVGMGGGEGGRARSV